VKTILTLIRLDLCEMLQRAGLEVCAEARDGSEAVELARSAEPDLAILDVKMPRLDGIEARGLDRRIGAEEDPDPHRDEQADERRPEGNGRR